MFFFLSLLKKVRYEAEPNPSRSECKRNSKRLAELGYFDCLARESRKKWPREYNTFPKGVFLRAQIIIEKLCFRLCVESAHNERREKTSTNNNTTERVGLLICIFLQPFCFILFLLIGFCFRSVHLIFPLAHSLDWPFSGLSDFSFCFVCVFFFILFTICILALGMTCATTNGYKSNHTYKTID